MKKLIIYMGILLAWSWPLAAADLSLSGSVISDNQKMITSRYMGFVTDVFVSEGKNVKKGDLLYKIDTREIDSAKAQVELVISQAKLASQMYENQYENVRLNLERNRRLLKKDMVSKFDVENLELAQKNLSNMVKISKEQIKQAQAKLQEVLNQYKYLDIKAPNDGVVVGKNIKVGEMAMPGMPAIILSDLTDLKISTEISENNLKDVKIGDSVDIEVPSVGLKGVGKISSIIPSSNPLTHTFKLKVTFNKKGKAVFPGMYAVVNLK
ncbi:efflux RND transporter periplasmic adaptor subunit [Sulfurospirillum sp. 1612]|uniref:efflux RND transporter periplasmic adaptor subunit n=1 Tax=Sulfurospirillum sp. 1612 TaxID=3094835 RepID=UPI002F943B08